jgi:RNA 2',3'-cyclic 3'-phosphodiesterase
MTGTASVGEGERPRLFLALVLPDDTVERLGRWQRAAFANVTGVRVVPARNLHVTLAFLGPRPASELDAIVAQLRVAASSARRPELFAVRYRETRSVGMVTLEERDGSAAGLADDVHGRLETIGVYRRESRPWRPHVTVLRFRRPPRLAPSPPELGRVSPSEAAVYHSVLRRAGAQYEVVESVPLGGS